MEWFAKECRDIEEVLYFMNYHELISEGVRIVYTGSSSVLGSIDKFQVFYLAEKELF